MPPRWSLLVQSPMSTWERSWGDINGGEELIMVYLRKSITPQMLSRQGMNTPSRWYCSCWWRWWGWREWWWWWIMTVVDGENTQHAHFDHCSLFRGLLWLFHHLHFLQESIKCYVTSHHDNSPLEQPPCLVHPSLKHPRFLGSVKKDWHLM